MDIQDKLMITSDGIFYASSALPLPSVIEITNQRAEKIKFLNSMIESMRDEKVISDDRVKELAELMKKTVKEGKPTDDVYKNIASLAVDFLGLSHEIPF